MGKPFFEDIQTLVQFWQKHQYCLPADCIEKGVRLLSTSSEAFRQEHSPYFLTKLINAFCSFETKISHQDKGIYFRLFKNDHDLHSVLGIAVTLKVNNQSDFLSQDRLLQSILHIVPGVSPVPQRSYLYRDDVAGHLFLYQEFEKKRGRGFANLDIQQLKSHLPKEIENSIEHYGPSLYLIRNEEEIFRNIVLMARDVNHPDDLPQVTISFQEQTSKTHIRFSVVIVRVVHPTTPSIKQLSKHLPQTILLLPEMTTEIGSIDNTHTKQANTLIIEIESGPFAKKNGAIDLREARQYVGKAIDLMLGDFRDFNGGIFSKQDKQLKALHEILGGEQKGFLEELFYSFSPAIFQTFVFPEAVKTCGSLFIELQKSKLIPDFPFVLLKHESPSFTIAAIKSSSEEIKSHLLKDLGAENFLLHQFGYAEQKIDGEYYLAFVYQYPQDSKWLETIETCLKRPQIISQHANQCLRINFVEGDPLSLNPQIGLDLRCRSLQKALFEGLTRRSPDGKFELAAAKTVKISEDQKTYHFTLRNLQWSNGEELTAFHFEKTWKKAICSPSALRPDFFYVIKNARKAHFKEVSKDAVGVKAIDKHTLEVMLEYPAPYFLEMLSHPLFFALYEESGEPYVFSGPFTLHSWKRHQSIVLVKNPYYWDFENVKLDRIEISLVRDSLVAFQKYEAGTLDWIGSPYCDLPLEMMEKKKQEMKWVDVPAVSWLYCNLDHPFFASNKVRKALSLALNRELICKKTLPSPRPLRTHLSSSLSSINNEEPLKTYDLELAHQLFEEGLRETQCDRKTLSTLRLLHSHIPGQKELATEIQRQWQEAFGLGITRVEESWNTFSHQLDNRLIHFGACYRHPFYTDPMYFFQIFYEKTNIHNAFGWHSEKFNHWIDQARAFPQDPTFLQKAELELMDQMPVIPIYEVAYYYLARPKMKGIYFCSSGDVDFKWIYFEEE